MLLNLSRTHSKTDAFLTWAWDCFDRDHAATVEASSVPRRIAWGGDDKDVPHISLDRPESAGTPARHETHAPDRGTGSARTSQRPWEVLDRAGALRSASPLLPGPLHRALVT